MKLVVGADLVSARVDYICPGLWNTHCVRHKTGRDFAPTAKQAKTIVAPTVLNQHSGRYTGLRNTQGLVMPVGADLVSARL